MRWREREGKRQWNQRYWCQRPRDGEGGGGAGGGSGCGGEEQVFAVLEGIKTGGGACGHAVRAWPGCLR